MADPALLALLIGIFFIILFVWLILWWAGVQAQRDKERLRRQRRKRSIRRQEHGSAEQRAEEGILGGSQRPPEEERRRREEIEQQQDVAIPEASHPAVHATDSLPPIPFQPAPNPPTQHNLAQGTAPQEVGYPEEYITNDIQGNDFNDQAETPTEHPPLTQAFNVQLDMHTIPLTAAVNPVIPTPTTPQDQPPYPALLRPSPVHITSFQRPNHKLPVFRYLVRTFSSGTDLEAGLGNASPNEAASFRLDRREIDPNGVLLPPAAGHGMETQQGEHDWRPVEERCGLWTKEGLAEWAMDGEKNGGEAGFGEGGGQGTEWDVVGMGE